MASAKQRGGLGIINPMAHANAMSVRFVIVLAEGRKGWAIMASNSLQLVKVFSQGGQWWVWIAKTNGWLLVGSRFS